MRKQKQMKQEMKKDNKGKLKKNDVRKMKDRVLFTFGRFATIRIKLTISFLVPIICIIALGILSFSSAANSIRSSYEQSTTQAVNMTSDYLQFGLESVDALAQQYIKDDSIKKYFGGQFETDSKEMNSTYKTIRSALLAKQTTDNFIADIYIFCDSVKPITTRKTDVSFSIKDFYETDYGKSVRENGKKKRWTGSNEYLDKMLGTAYSLRYIRRLDGVDAIVVIDVDLDTTNQIVNNLGSDETGTVGFITGDGKEIISGKNDGSEKVFTDKKFYIDTVSKISENKEGTQTRGAFYVKVKGKDNLFIYSAIGSTGAMISALVPKDAFLKRADNIKKVTIIIVVIACVIAVLIGGLISIGIDKAIKGIIKGLKRAAQGDMTVEFNSKRKDEFHILNEEIQNTFSNMKGLIQQVKQLSTEVSASSENVASTSQTFLKASESISGAMNEIEQGVNQQAKDAEECLQQMDNLSEKITVVSDNTKAISKLADDTKKSINDGTVVTQDLNSQTKATMDIASEIIHEIEALEEKSLSIGEIISVINDIANQTNLLSLNASIEAARAGEYGRGFAVVADEIRKLAEQSRMSVNEIQQIIKNIQDGTKNAVLTAKKAENVMTLQETAVENTTDSFGRINQNVEKLVVNLNGILENVVNIEQARVSTLGAIENMSAVLEEIAASSNTVNQTAYDQLQTVESLNKATASLNKNSEQLVKAVDAFTI